MQLTVKTSKLYKKRMLEVPNRLELVRNAIAQGNFSEMAATIMEDSDDMHACMADTIPPIVYLNSISRQIMKSIREMNASEPVAAYTFDAGPNANIYTSSKHVGEIKSMLRGISGIDKVLECRIGRGALPSSRHLF